MEHKEFKVKNSKLKISKPKVINLPLTKQDVLKLRVGDMVLINGLIATGRDRLHTFLFRENPSRDKIPFNLEGTILYHCGPIVQKTPRGFEVVAAGPTTSMRIEMYEHRIISRYGLRGVMGKGGMGRQTLDAMKKNGCAYFHTVGGAAVYLADKVKRVVNVWKLEEFGMTEAMWLLDVYDFPAIVTMDAYGKSLHEEIEKHSYNTFKYLINLNR